MLCDLPKTEQHFQKAKKSQKLLKTFLVDTAISSMLGQLEATFSLDVY